MPPPLLHPELAEALLLRFGPEPGTFGALIVTETGYVLIQEDERRWWFKHAWCPRTDLSALLRFAIVHSGFSGRGKRRSLGRD